MAPCGVVDVQISAVKDFAALGLKWRDLEQRANGSFFQSWTWVGCLAAERFSDPVLVQATDAGRIVALVCVQPGPATVRRGHPVT